MNHWWNWRVQDGRRFEFCIGCGVVRTPYEREHGL